MPLLVKAACAQAHIAVVAVAVPRENTSQEGAMEISPCKYKHSSACLHLMQASGGVAGHADEAVAVGAVRAAGADIYPSGCF